MEDFSIRLDDYMQNRANVVVANPNAPTGLALRKCEIEQIVAANPDYVVLIDEAYVDFGAETVVGLVNEYDNLLVTKIHGGGTIGLCFRSFRIDFRS